MNNSLEYHNKVKASTKPWSLIGWEVWYTVHYYLMQTCMFIWIYIFIYNVSLFLSSWRGQSHKYLLAKYNRKIWAIYLVNRILKGPSVFFNSAAPEECDSNIRNVILNRAWQVVIMTFSLGNQGHVDAVEPMDESGHCFRWWFGAIREQAITRSNVDPDLCRHTALLGHNELSKKIWSKYYDGKRVLLVVNIYVPYARDLGQLCRNCWHRNLSQRQHQWPLLLTWFNFNPSMDK